MDLPIQVAVRVFSENDNDTPGVVQTFISSSSSPTETPSTSSPAVIKVDGHSFPATYALQNCSQSQVYHQTVLPLISSYLDGYDVSIVTYGQKNTGKTYTMFGPGFNCIYGEGEQGVLQRSIRDIFTQLSNQTDRNYVLNIGWVELCGEQVNDLLAGMVQVTSVVESFQWLQIGLSNKSLNQQHNLISLTLEQQWISADGLIQHRLSTLSFCDLGGTKEPGLYHLEKIVSCLTDTQQMYNNNVDYNQTALTSLLKDSFGGRAQTLMILCVSPYKDDTEETISNLQFGYMVQLVRNFVIMNTFSDNNTLVHDNSVRDVVGDDHVVDTFGLQFAASQWLKLVSNAEGLFSKLVTSKTLTEQDREQIEEWMFLKSECEDCLSSGELNQRLLGPIQETEEPGDTSDPETPYQQNTDNESDSESQRPDFEEKIENLMEEFRIKTDSLVHEKYQEFQKIQPKAIFDSNDSLKLDERPTSQSENQRNRRKSIQPGSSLSSNEIAMLHQVASREKIAEKIPADEFLDSSTDLRNKNSRRLELIQKKIRDIDSDMDTSKTQIKELENTIVIKQKLIAEYIKSNDTRTTAKQRFNKKKNKLESEYEKTKKQLAKAVINGTDKNEIERLHLLTSHIEQRLQILGSMKQIAGEGGQKIKKIQKSIQESRKEIELLQKTIKKQKKTKESLENDLKTEKTKEGKSSTTLISSGKKNLRDVTARISHLDHVLKEKSENFELYMDGGNEKESLRHEIKNLRRTKDLLIEKRCQLDKKLKKEKILSHLEERKLMECDEAIEAIDAAMEFKNELICGRKSVDTNEKLQREKGERMLMGNLNNLSIEELRPLLYKYFQKVIDLKESSRKLEIHLMNLEREWDWREKMLKTAVIQARTEGENNAYLLQHQHETKLNVMLRHLAEETSTNSSLQDRFLSSGSTSLTGHQQSQLNYSESDMELDLYKPSTSKQFRSTKYSNLDLYPLSQIDGHLNKYKPLDKYKEKETRETKNKLFAKIQVLARYHGSDKRKLQQQQQLHHQQQLQHLQHHHHHHNQHDISSTIIPQQNLRQLQSSTVPVTKVTREKNKIIIQQDTTGR